MLLAEPLRQLDLMSLTRLASSHQHQSTVIKGQWSIVLCRPSPDLERSVSDERIAPKPMQRTAQARFYAEVVLPVAVSQIGVNCAGEVGSLSAECFV
jgi:hypothetical protein